MLSIQNLDIRYGPAHVVRDLALEVEKGEIMVLVGPTGCGKSSVLRAIAGFIQPSDGEILIDGQATSRGAFLPPEKRNTGIVFQDFALFPHLDVESNVGFRVRDPSQVAKWLSTLGLEPFRRAMPETLSGGQKQRVALARSLAHQPKLLLLDEPLSNLDAALKSELRAEIRQAIKQANVTAVWVTHDQDEAMGVGDRIAVMRHGRIDQVGTPEICYERPGSRFVAQFLGDGRFLQGIASDAHADTALGPHPFVRAKAKETAPQLPPGPLPVEILVRPHDIGLEPATPGNGTVAAQLFEGETRRYLVQLDSGESVEARLTHEARIDPGARVRAFVQAQHPLVAFPRQP